MSAFPPSRAEAERIYEELVSDPGERPEAQALDRLGLLIDLSGMLARVEGANIAIQRGEAMLQSELSSRTMAVTHFVLSNAYEVRRTLTRSGWELYEWEQPELELQIVHLRHAGKIGTEVRLESTRLCQIFTNLGNLLSHCGRLADAIASWDRALSIDPGFAMALGNRGYGRLSYGRLQHDPGHRVLHLRSAHRDLHQALERPDELYAEAEAAFQHAVWQITGGVPGPWLYRPAHDHYFRKNSGPRELAYRKWCLEERLFLNDLNELGVDPIAAADVLTLPSMTTPLDAPQPSAIGFFNQLKQEYVSARYFYYRGVTADGPHYSDRDVTMINTPDYPVYGLAAEYVKVAFRIAYSLFDKVAYFLNDYFNLRIAESRVSFRSLWYNKQDKKRGIRSDLTDPRNSALRALFWIAKDMHESDPAFQEAVEPEARQLANIRNHLEHKYFKLHQFGVPQSSPDRHFGFEQLAYSVERHDFDTKALHVLKSARSALLHVSMAVYLAEAQRTSDDTLAFPMFLDTWEDDWKV